MIERTFKAKAYLKEGCPYSFKFLVFMRDAELMDQIEAIRLPESGPQIDAVKQKIGAATGKDVTFPTVETAPGEYRSDSNKLIAHYADLHGIDRRQLATFSFFFETIYPQLLQHH